MASYLINNRSFSREINTNFLQSKLHQSIRLHISKRSLLYLEDLDEIYPDSIAFIFLSQHRSLKGIPSLTCHCTGNFGNNLYGGNPRELGIAYPYLQKQYLKTIVTLRALIPGYDVVIESSHHGPTSLKKPVLFIEIGSTANQWTDRNSSSVVCESILRVIENGLGSCEKVAIGLGGTHYPIKFNKLLLESEYGLAAIAAKHNLESIDKEILDQMIIKSIEKVTHVIVDWKGLGGEKTRIMELIRSTGLDILRV
ncbi:MAG TPA: D-aminoacyl-tRNA deacylase [Candidatus Nitrosopolaris sp.]|nr:D-aminoacyl-tRNA deacylase [Candidatus Nitrosopolaris sp.]